MSSEPDVEKWDPWQPRELSQRLSEAKRIGMWLAVGRWTYGIAKKPARMRILNSAAFEKTRRILWKN